MSNFILIIVFLLIFIGFVLLNNRLVTLEDKEEIMYKVLKELINK